MKITTTKQLNLAQLTAELGGIGLSTRPAEDGTTEVEAHGAVTPQQLTDAVAAHLPDPNFSLSVEQKRKKELAAKATLSASETAEAIKLYLKGV